MSPSPSRSAPKVPVPPPLITVGRSASATGGTSATAISRTSAMSIVPLRTRLSLWDADVGEAHERLAEVHARGWHVQLDALRLARQERDEADVTHDPQSRRKRAARVRHEDDT